MRKILIPFIGMFLVACVFILNKNKKQAVQVSEIIHKDVHSEEEELPKRTRMDLAMEHELLMTQDPALGYAPRERLLDAHTQIKTYIKEQDNSRSETLPNAKWKERGPYSVGGRTRALLVDLNDETRQTVWVAGVAGGLWKTSTIDNNPPNWQPIDDYFANMNICAIAQDPVNTQNIYFGTGEGYFNGDASRGLGMYRSTDGGENWTYLSTTINSDFHYVQKIVVHPDNGDLYVATRNAGVQFSSDRGNTWTKVCGGGVNGTTNKNDVSDIEIDVEGNLYACFGYTTSNSQIYRSINNASVGTNWTRLTAFQIGHDRCELAVSKTEPGRLYVLATTGNDATALYRSTNKGDNFVTLPVPSFGGFSFTSGQGWYNLDVEVDPNDPDRVFIAGIDIFLSENGGANWTAVTSAYGGNAPYMHPDQHIIHFEPGNSNVIYFGNDGGIYKTKTGANQASSISVYPINQRYNVTQFYCLAVHPGEYSNYFLAGSQDNGSLQFTQFGLGNTTEVLGGDGAFCHIDQDEPEYQIVSSQFGNYVASSNGGESFNFGTADFGGGFINASDYDDKANTLYCQINGGNSSYYRWNLQGSQEAVTVSGITGATFGHVSVDPNVDHRVYFGTTGGGVIKVDNANTGTTVPGINLSAGSGMPSVFVSCVAVETGDSDHLLVTFSNYGVNSVWESVDGGANWTSVEGNLPDIPVRWAIFNPTDGNQVLLATETGVWVTEQLNGTNTVWEPSINGMPFVRTDMLQYRASDNLIAAGTHARGLFSTDNFSTPFPDMLYQKVGYTDAEYLFLDRSINPDYWQWTFGDGSTSSVQNPRKSYETKGTYDISLSITSNLSSQDEIKILPDKQIPYAISDGGNFEASAADFGVHTLSGTPFELGESSQGGKSGTHSGQNAWVVGKDVNLYENNTHTILYTPNYDLSEPNIYEIGFWAKYDIQNGWDGFRVEYSTNRGVNWSVLGRVNDTWYNYKNNDVTTSFPKSTPYFTGQSSGWEEYKTDITELAGEENVAFRFVFKSDANSQYPGLALDDFKISTYEGELATKLISLSAEYLEYDIVRVNWVTSPEYLNEGFSIEISENGRDFSEVRYVGGQGSTPYETGYQIDDENKRLNLYYYRIKVINEVDSNANFYSPIVVVQRDAEDFGLNAVFPNPFNDQVNITFNNLVEQESIDVRVFDAVGRLVKHLTVPINGVHAQVPLEGMAPGMYVLRVKVGDEEFSYKLAKQQQ